MHNVLSDKKMLLKLALLSLTESMRKDPDKYNAFIFCDNKSSSSTTQTRSYSQYYDTAPYGQQQQIPITGLHICANRGSRETVQ